MAKVVGRGVGATVRHKAALLVFLLWIGRLWEDMASWDEEKCIGLGDVLLRGGVSHWVGGGSGVLEALVLTNNID